MHLALVMLASIGCGDDESPVGGSVAGGAGGSPTAGAPSGGAPAGGASSGGAPSGGAASGGAPMGGASGGAGGEAAGGEGGSSPAEMACQAYCDASAGCELDAFCVNNCLNGIDDPCVAQWIPYTNCLAENYDSVACNWQFHPCEAEATAVGKCLDATVCLSQCDDTVDGCSCTHACVGTDFAWDCTVDGANVNCACSHDGVPTFECSDVSGSCATLLYAGCCLGG